LAELPEQYNAEVSEKRSAEVELIEAPTGRVLGRRELESYIDQLGDVGQALSQADAEELAELDDRVDKYCVRGGTRTLTTRLDLEVYRAAGQEAGPGL
jgi:hypothetical protein